jgi:glycine/D-amino acid oxidase-like deaminating enzyme
VPFGDVEKSYGSQYYFLHRADLLNVLLKTAKEKRGITVKTGCKVVEYDFEGPRVRTADGAWWGGDVVVAADGKLSRCFLLVGWGMEAKLGLKVLKVLREKLLMEHLPKLSILVMWLTVSSFLHLGLLEILNSNILLLSRGQQHGLDRRGIL